MVDFLINQLISDGFQVFPLGLKTYLFAHLRDDEILEGRKNARKNACTPGKIEDL
jgi:hypothetical protein